MNFSLIVIVFILLTCIALNKVSSKLGVPVLLLFIMLGLIAGWDDASVMESAKTVESTCSIALIFIIFYGGFGTKWSTAKPVVRESGILASAGVFATAAITGLFCHFALKWGWAESFLMGSVISSTDAATVFSILRNHKMGLKNNTAPMLEIESGSNDPCSYMLTIIMISIIKGEALGGKIVWMVLAQVGFGAIFGCLIAQGAIWVLRHTRMAPGFYSLFFVAVAIASYAFPSTVGGNGYLSAYLTGIIIGNTEFNGRKVMMNFFDGVTSSCQIIIFYLLGLMAIPENLFKAFLPALLVFLFLTLVSRPISVAATLAPFRKYPSGQIGFVSFVGLRGAASIVFAIMTLDPAVHLQNDVFSLVFCIVLISIGFQGSLIPLAAKLFRMTDNNSDVMQTFNDFSETEEIAFSSFHIGKDSPWAGKIIKDLNFPKEILIVLILRDKKKIVPKGHTELAVGDEIIISSKSYSSDMTNIIEHPLSKNSQWIGHPIKDYPFKEQGMLVMVKRGEENIIPNGSTILKQGDILYILQQQ